ncbi:MAG: isoprenyl transferase [Bacteroidetes bacterium]|jgi:undecaprenyl diphosphate synthase|nr:isoprenyl transferase [Bacteroidota bacterium]MBK9319942.1 isoprenyl transferase [Bacteroidota bacterium]
MSLKEKIDLQRLPRHVAIIMDGNGRWAKQHGKIRTFGHQNGVKAVRDTVEGAAELGVEVLTLYAFSTENWSRPRFEIDALMHLLVQTISKETPTLMENNIRLATIGNTESLPDKVLKNLNKSIEKTAGNSRMTLVLALSYSSRWEITNAVQNIAREVKEGLLKPEDISEKIISQHLNTAAWPDPELLIRTSGEARVSNYLLWQIAYAELYFTQKLWPDFRREDLYEAIIDFQNRERRFGKTSEQLKSEHA